MINIEYHTPIHNQPRLKSLKNGFLVECLFMSNEDTGTIYLPIILKEGAYESLLEKIVVLVDAMMDESFTNSFSDYSHLENFHQIFTGISSWPSQPSGDNGTVAFCMGYGISHYDSEGIVSSASITIV